MQGYDDFKAAYIKENFDVGTEPTPVPPTTTQDPDLVTWLSGIIIEAIINNNEMHDFVHDHGQHPSPELFRQAMEEATEYISTSYLGK